MKRLIYGLLLCFVIATSQVAWRRTTNRGNDEHKLTHLVVIQPFLVVTHRINYELIKVGRLVIPQVQLITIHTQATQELPILLQHHQCQQCHKTLRCRISGGISTFGVGISGGTYITDENCERIKLSKVLNDLGMKVAKVSILCQDPRVFFAMEQSGTRCPFEGKIGTQKLTNNGKNIIS